MGASARLAHLAKVLTGCYLLLVPSARSAGLPSIFQPQGCMIQLSGTLPLKIKSISSRQWKSAIISLWSLEMAGAAVRSGPIGMPHSESLLLRRRHVCRHPFLRYHLRNLVSSFSRVGEDKCYQSIFSPYFSSYRQREEGKYCISVGSFPQPKHLRSTYRINQSL